MAEAHNGREGGSNNIFFVRMCVSSGTQRKKSCLAITLTFSCLFESLPSLSILTRILLLSLFLQQQQPQHTQAVTNPSVSEGSRESALEACGYMCEQLEEGDLEPQQTNEVPFFLFFSC